MSESALLSPAAWSFGLALVILTAFGVQLARSWRGGLSASMLVVAVLVAALWAGTGLAFSVWREDGLWRAWRTLDLLRGTAWCVFLVSLLKGREARSWVAREHIRAVRIGSVLAVAVVVFGIFYSVQPPGAQSLTTFPSRFGFGLSLALAILGLVFVEQLLRTTPRGERWGIKPLCLGLGGMFVFELFLHADGMLLGQLDVAVWSALGAVQGLVIPLVAVATTRNKWWTIELALSRQVVFHSTALLGSGVYLLTVAALGYYVRYSGGTWGAVIQTALLFAALLLLALMFSSGTLRSKLRVLLNKHFFAYRYDYREEWLRFTKLLSSSDPGPGIYTRCVLAIADLVESGGGALWLKRDGREFRQVARFNMAEVSETESADGPLAHFLTANSWVIDLEELGKEPTRYPGLWIPTWLKSLAGAWLVVPLLSADTLLGFVVLAKPRVRVEINWEVRDLLKTIGRQAASYLLQIEATEALLEARKFDAFNRMSAFVVHDLKNLVAQLQLLLRNAERHSDNPEFQRDMLDTIRHVADRMTRMLMQLRVGETPVENARSVDLSAIARRVEQSKAGLSPRIVLDAPEPVSAWGHEDRLEHVLAHLVQNALDASPHDGTVAVSVRRDGQYSVVEIRDVGDGMTAEFMRERLFKPFQTTKPGGMGIGVYESDQYVTSLGGRIRVESKPNEGTRVRVFVPEGRTGSVPTPQMTEVA